MFFDKSKKFLDTLFFSLLFPAYLFLLLRIIQNKIEQNGTKALLQDIKLSNAANLKLQVTSPERDVSV
jgi:hypothetical protein